MRKRKLLLIKLLTSSLMLLLFEGFKAKAQSLPPASLWANHPDGHLVGGTYPAISADGNGNTYVTGGFDGTFSFSTSPSPTALTSAGEGDIFIAKYDATGNVIWAKRVGGTHNEVANAIKYDGFGNIYIVGDYSGSTDFEGTILNSESGSWTSVFIAKYNATTGNLLWVKQGAANTASAFDIAVDKYGDAYITGRFGTITFDPLPTLNSVGDYDLFVVKYNSDGTPQWQTSAGSSEPNQAFNSEQGNGIAVDASGNVFVTGCFNGSTTYPSHFGSISLVSNDGGGLHGANFFLAKYSQSTSSWEWVVQGGGNTLDNGDFGKSVSLDGQGNIYVSGDFEGTGIFGSTTLTSTGVKDYFLAKYSTHGVPLWVRSTGGVGNISTSKVDANGNFYFAGVFDGPVVVGNQTLTLNGYLNSYISGWNSNGDFQWVKHIPNNYVSFIGSLEIENNGNIDVTSVFSFTETFDCTTFESGTYADLAIAKLGYSNGSTTQTIQASAITICSGNSTTLSIVNGNLNNATDWKWYSGSCGGTFIGSGSSIAVTPTQTTTYFARSEGGCDGPSECGSIVISINSTPPAITSVTAPVAPVIINTSINLTTVYAGNNVTNASIKWGDASSEQSVANPASSFVVPHIYTAPGVYSINVSLKDACNQTVSTVYQYVVVYDPSGGFATGGGWINSPAGAYRPDLALTGKAIFGFESKYQKGTTVPSGNTEFKFQVANLNFKSTNYEWLVVSGSRAQFKGSGTINGTGNYGFLLTSVDGDLGNMVSQDLFRIKIWDKNSSAIVYDNQYGSGDDGSPTTQIGGGSIVIHIENNNSSTTRTIDMAPAQTSNNELTVTALPNPSIQYFVLNVRAGFNLPISIRIIDILGRTIEMKQNVSANASIKIGDEYLPGVYYAEFIQGHQRKIIKLVKSGK